MLVSNGLAPDQDRQNVRPDLGPNCFQRLSADEKRFLASGQEIILKTPIMAALDKNLCDIFPYLLKKTILIFYMRHLADELHETSSLNG